MRGIAKTAAELTILILSACLALGLSGLASGAPQSKAEPTVQEGRSLYARYCRSCHGDEAKGDGPAAPALKVPPTDLTKIAGKYGSFPTDKVMDSIDGEKNIPGHGSKEMPVWGRRFRRSPGGQKGSQSEIVLLTRYLQSIQER